jgi:hypothetical protein
MERMGGVRLILFDELAAGPIKETRRPRYREICAESAF